MRCFNHRTSQAIGICKHCQKGLCAKCAVDVNGGMACKDSCEQTVKELNLMIEANLKHYRAAFGSVQTLPWTHLLFGTAFFVFALWTSLSELKALMFGFSALYFVLAWLNRRRKTQS